MSKSIRIRDHLYEEIARRAEEEHRPLVSQLEMLLEQALRMKSPVTVTSATVPVATETGTSVVPDPHFKPDPKGGRR